MVQLDGTPVDLPLLAHMAAALDHRGPDAEGHMVDETVGLYHKRLSIIENTYGDTDYHLGRVADSSGLI